MADDRGSGGMATSRWQRGLAWSLSAAVLLALVLGWVLGRGDPEIGNAGFFVVYGLSALATSSLGLLLVLRRSHPVGWLLQVVSLLQILLATTWAYATHGAAGPEQLGTLPGAYVSAWFSDQLWIVTLMLSAVFIPLVFPDGRLPSPRWRHVFRMAIVALVLGWLPIALEESLYSFQDVAAPLSAFAPPAWFQDVAEVISTILATVALVAALASPVVRWRRGDVVERQQLKWLLGAIALLIVTQLTVNVAGLEGVVANALTASSVLALPAALTAAILRYRLFDIDRLFRRTAGYVLALGVLAGFYAVAVVGLSRLVPAAGDSNTEELVARLQHLLGDQIGISAVVDELAATIAVSLEPVTIAVHVSDDT